MWIDLRTSGATCALVANLTSPVVSVQPLADIVNAADWTPYELVGLPVDGPLGDYDGGKQGMLTALTDPTSAALDRLVPRGAAVRLVPGAALRGDAARLADTRPAADGRRAARASCSPARRPVHAGAART